MHAIAAIHTQGIEDRVATFEARAQGPAAAAQRMARGPVLVAERDGEVVGWAGIGPYEHYTYYAGVGEVTVYVRRAARGDGVGRALLEAVSTVGEQQGRHKLLAKVFATNVPSVSLFKRCGYREVGTHRRHGRLDGRWHDVIVLELLIGEAAGQYSA